MAESTLENVVAIRSALGYQCWMEWGVIKRRASVEHFHGRQYAAIQLNPFLAYAFAYLVLAVAEEGKELQGTDNPPHR
jgi:hypothetical protein